MAIKDDMEDVQEAVINELITDNGLNPLTVGDGEITTAKIADGAVGTAKIADGAITAPKLGVSFAPAQGSLSTGQLADGAVTRPKLANNAVTNAKISDGAVTSAKLSQAYLPLAGGSVSGNVTFGDSDKASFGAGSDLQLYHNGTHGFVDNSTGDMNVQTNGAMYLTGSTINLYDGTNVNLAVDSSGRVMIGTVTEGAANEAEELTISSTGSVGMTIRSTDSGSGRIYFSDGTSGTSEYAGYQIYNHSSNAMIFGTNAVERMRINSQGHVILSNVPTSSSGLTTGTIYSDGGTLKIV